jgi:pimeloyl-ACP methyl ester carboxylesterase
VRELAHQRAGDGPRPVVLLHGLLGSARNLATLARGLAARDATLGVVALDLTGHGASPPLPPGAGSATLAADVVATARALGLTSPMALVGHSLGGRVALRVAGQSPAQVASVTLLDVAPGTLSGDGEVARVLGAVLSVPAAFSGRGEARAALLATGLSPGLVDWLLLNLEPAGDAYRWRVDRDALAALHATIAREDLWPVVERPRPWALACVRGGASPHVSDGDARRLQASGARVVTIEGAGHFLHAEQPGPVLDAVTAGVSRV